jgi:hypothetical protein
MALKLTVAFWVVPEACCSTGPISTRPG